MKCNRAQLYGTDDPAALSARTRRVLEEHLSDCPSCRQSVERSRAVASLVRLKQHEQPEPEFMENFVKRFHQRMRLEKTIRVRAPGTRSQWLWAEPAVLLRTAFATVLLTLAMGRILWVSLGGAGAPMMAEPIRSSEIQVAGQPWFGAGPAPSASNGRPLFIIRPQPRAVDRRPFFLYNRIPVTRASYEF